MAGMMLIVGLAMMLFPPGWRVPLEALTLPGTNIRMPGYFWPASLLTAALLQGVALLRGCAKSRRWSACLGAVASAIMAMAFVQANYLVVSAPVFAYLSVWQWFVFAALRDMAVAQSWKG